MLRRRISVRAAVRASDHRTLPFLARNSAFLCRCSSISGEARRLATGRGDRRSRGLPGARATRSQRPGSGARGARCRRPPGPPAAETSTCSSAIAAGGDVAPGQAAPGEPVVLDVEDLAARERRAVGRERVHVEDQQPAGREVARHRRERVAHVVLAEQMVERVVDAGDEVEAAEDRQRSHVVAAHRARVGHLRRSDPEHAARLVAADDVEACLEQRDEALARPARHVERAAPAEPVITAPIRAARRSSGRSRIRR